MKTLKPAWKKIYNGWYELEWQGFFYRIAGKSGNYIIDSKLIGSVFLDEIGKAKNLNEAQRIVDLKIWEREIYNKKLKGE